MLIRLLYTLLLFLVSPVLLFGLYKSKPNKPKFGGRWQEHFGLTPALEVRGNPLWIHAVSVGECVAAIPLIRELKRQRPQQNIVVTTTTSTGAAQIEQLGHLVEHRYMPVDFAFAVRGFLRAIQPSQLLIIETELWPNTLYAVHRSGVPVTVVNARLSEKSRKNYARIQPLFNLMHPCMDKILCQSQADAERFEQLGVHADKLFVTGSIKFDIQISDSTINRAHELRGKLGPSRPVWIAASTHRGEDEIILDAHTSLLKAHPDALLIIVPRHPERFDSVYQSCCSQGFVTIRRTHAQHNVIDSQVYLADTMGEMLVLIGCSDVCFMGGSLCGDKVGGHNVLEPAALGKPIITGPSYFNFKESVDAISSLGAIEIINDASQLARSLISILEDSDQQLLHKQLLLDFVSNNSGAKAKVVAHI